MIVSYNFYYAQPGNAAAVLRQRICASDVRARLGLPRGRIISKLEGVGDWPDVIWRLDFADMAAQDADMAVRAASTEFEDIRRGMRQLYRRFERPLYATREKSAASVPSLPQTIMLYGVYCEASECAAATEALNSAGTVEFISGAKEVPQMICETAGNGLPESVRAKLRQLPVRIEHSVWQIAVQD